MRSRLVTLLRKQSPVALLALFVALSGTSFAAVKSTAFGASAKDTLIACVGKNTGRMRMVDSPSRCGSLETAVTFNREGDRGPKGKPGDDGKRGLTGTAGTNGSNGATGAAGSDGAVGAKGDTGADSTIAGPTGDKGDPGLDGSTGDKGDKGDEGDEGDTGTGLTATTQVPSDYLAIPFAPFGTTTVLSVSLTTPRAGKLLVTGDLGMLITGASGRATMSVHHNASQVYERVVDWVGFTTVPVSAIVNVGAGAQTIEVRVGKGGSAGNLEATGRGLSLAFLG